MTRKISSPLFKIGDNITIRYHPATRGRVVELRVRLVQAAPQIYGLRMTHTRRPHYIEVREDQMIPVPADDARSNGSNTVDAIDADVSPKK